MKLWIVLTLTCTVVITWVVAGRYEYKPSHKLAMWMERMKRRMYEANQIEALSLTIEAKEFIHDDIEKEIYIIRKSRKHTSENIVMKVDISSASLKQEEREKTKQRLEKRFPGLTVNFSPEGQEKNHAVLCADRS